MNLVSVVIVLLAAYFLMREGMRNGSEKSKLIALVLVLLASWFVPGQIAKYFQVPLIPGLAGSVLGVLLFSQLIRFNARYPQWVSSRVKCSRLWKIGMNAMYVFIGFLIFLIDGIVNFVIALRVKARFKNLVVSVLANVIIASMVPFQLLLMLFCGKGLVIVVRTAALFTIVWFVFNNPVLLLYSTALLVFCAILLIAGGVSIIMFEGPELGDEEEVLSSDETFVLVKREANLA